MKKIKIIVIIICSLIIIYSLIILADFLRVKNHQNPIFSIKHKISEFQDDYIGLGYNANIYKNKYNKYNEKVVFTIFGNEILTDGHWSVMGSINNNEDLELETNNYDQESLILKAKIKNIKEDTLEVEPINKEDIEMFGDIVIVNLDKSKDMKLNQDQIIDITYTPIVTRSIPPQIVETNISIND